MSGLPFPSPIDSQLRPASSSRQDPFHKSLTTTTSDLSFELARKRNFPLFLSISVCDSAVCPPVGRRQRSHPVKYLCFVSSWFPFQMVFISSRLWPSSVRQHQLTFAKLIMKIECYLMFAIYICAALRMCARSEEPACGSVTLSPESAYGSSRIVRAFTMDQKLEFLV